MEELHNHFAAPPGWSLAIGIAGKAFIILAVASLLVSMLSWLLSPKSKKLEKVGGYAFTVGGFSLLASYVALAVLFVAGRLEYEYVWGHSDLNYGISYRLAGVWAGQEGSFLLWACCSAIFGMLAAARTGIYRRWFTSVYSLFLASIGGILAYETPFALNMIDGQPVVPESGAGLSPALQNYWMVIHPPVIFLGFGCLTVLAAYAFAAMATNKLHDWAPMVRPWSILAMTLTGLGLCLGGFWAYETLGWGGFWMWDPVENVSFVPWVLCAGLVHGLIVQINRKKWAVSNLLLGGLPFMLFVYGTFLTRSGVLSETSVHSFAEMDRVAHRLLLGFMGGSILTFTGLWIFRAFQHERRKKAEVVPVKGINRESAYRWGVLLLTAMAVGTAIGMSVPMFMALAGQKPKMVEEPMYHRVLAWVYIPLMISMAIAPLTAWRGMGMKQFMKRIYGVTCVTFVVVGYTMVAASSTPWTRMLPSSSDVMLPFGQKVSAVPWVIMLVALSIAVIVANVWRVFEVFKGSKAGVASFLSHIGLAVMMAGLIISRGFEHKAQMTVVEGGHDTGLGFFVAFKGVTGDFNKSDNKVQFDVTSEHSKFVASPGLWYSPTPDGRENPVVTPHIERRWTHDIYLALSPRVTDVTEPITLETGQKGKLDRFEVQYLGTFRESDDSGHPTKLGADVRVFHQGATIDLKPTVEFVNGKVNNVPAMLGDYKIIIEGISPAMDGVTLKLQYAKAIYPLEILYKPMTILVWIGTFMLAIAGLVAAWYRRRPKSMPTRAEPEGAPTDAAEPKRELVGSKR